MKILILEESPLARRFIKEELLPMGFELLEAATPQDALDILCTVPDIALITLRVVMKGMDGFQFLEHLNTPEVQVRLKEAGNHRTPAVIVTSNDTDQDRLRGFQVGAADFIQKPWPPGELLERLSAELTLQAGDAVFTGTPAGVGPLRPGDRVRARVEGLPELEFSIGRVDSAASDEVKS